MTLSWYKTCDHHRISYNRSDFDFTSHRFVGRNSYIAKCADCVTIACRIVRHLFSYSRFEILVLMTDNDDLQTRISATSPNCSSYWWKVICIQITDHKIPISNRINIINNKFSNGTIRMSHLINTESITICWFTYRPISIGFYLSAPNRTTKQSLVNKCSSMPWQINTFKFEKIRYSKNCYILVWRNVCVFSVQDLFNPNLVYKFEGLIFAFAYLCWR